MQRPRVKLVKLVMQPRPYDKRFEPNRKSCQYILTPGPRFTYVRVIAGAVALVERFAGTPRTWG